jgi:hypothetical protein
VNWNAISELEAELLKLYKKSFPSTRWILMDYHYNAEEQMRVLGKLNKEFWRDFNK